MKPITTLASHLLLAGALLAGCHDDHDHDNEHEVITTVTLELAPMGGGATVSASFDDPDGNGGAAPTIDPIVLAAGTTYTTTVRFLNKLEDPPEEITDEIRDEGDEHQVFFTGSAVNGPAADNPNAPLTHSYADTDTGGLPLGLTNTIAAAAAGTGQLQLTLRHLPPINNNPTKTAGLADQVKTGGFAAIGGENDVDVTFMVTVQ